MPTDEIDAATIAKYRAEIERAAARDPAAASATAKVFAALDRHDRRTRDLRAENAALRAEVERLRALVGSRG